ncbi:MAG: glucose 1-dehydrogenase [Anaerolineae bacterium]|nr:glucose 1-dehydrogenase [Anaerolineae bacterium]
MSDRVLSAAPIMDRFRLEGRVALVTGAGQGIGRGFAHALGEAGAAVAVVDLVEEKARLVTEELQAKGIDALAIAADVTESNDIQCMVDGILDQWGRLTIGVNNAGIVDWAAAEDASEEHWDSINDLNLKAVFRCAQAEARVMLGARYGKIINTASMSASVVNTPQRQTVYNTTKAGVLHMTRSLAAEWAPHGICVNSISPGYTRTQLVADMLETQAGQEIAPKWMALTPMGRMGEVTDLQGAIVYLASSVSDFMTGHDLIIDGGYCCW